MSPSSATDQKPRIQLFGGARIFLGGEEIPLSPHQTCLVGLLFGTEEGVLARAEAISFLWPEEEPTRARRRLSQLLYSLKRRVGQESLIDSHGDDIRKAGEGVKSDLEEYALALNARQFPVCTGLLQKGFAARGVGALNRRYDDWVRAKEAELRHEVRRKAERHWHHCVQEENWGGARVAAEALLALAPQDEERLKKVMEARAKSGWAAGAEEAFKDFEALCGVRNWAPEEDTLGLLDTIRSAFSTQPEVRAAEAGKGAGEPPLLGRDIEMNAFRKALRNIPAKDLRGFLVLGDAGIGKTRLIRESLLGLAFDGQLVLSAEAAEMEQLIPLNPLIEVLKGSEAGEALRQLDEPWRTVLFGVMPAHYLGDGPIPEAPQIQPGSVPRRLFEAFYQLLIALTNARPLIVVLEDLQWADETTLSVLEFLLRRWDHGNLQLLVSARAEEVRRHPLFGRFLETLRVHHDFVEVHLSELEPHDRESLIRHLAGKPLGPHQVSQLQSLAGGNPFFLIELTLEFLAGRLGPVATPRDLVPIPVSIRQVLDRRLSQLSSDADRVLGSLAVFSRPLDLPGLVRIAHLSRPKCLAGLDQLHHFRLVTSRGTEVTISHELVRQSVYQGINPTRRAWLHDRVARHLLRNRKTAPPDELAVHFHHAGASSEAITYAIETADRAEASGAIPEALRFLRIAREHSKAPEQVADLIGRMGHLNYLHQNLEEAAPLLELAAQRFRRQGDRARALRAEVERIDCLARTGEHLGNDCLEELQLLKEDAISDGLWEIFQEALDVEAHQLDRAGNLVRVRSVLSQARQHQSKGTAEARCKARAMIALNIYFGSPTEGLRAAREAVTLAKATADSELLLHALNRLIVALHYQGRLHSPEGIQALSEAEARLGNCGDLILRFFLKLNRAVWHLEIGELDYAHTGFRAAAEIVHGTQARDAQAMLHLNLGELGLVSHEFRHAKESYETAQALIAPNSPHFFQTLVTTGLGLCALQTGDLGEARRNETELPPLPEFWSYDPTVVAVFKARMFLKRRDTPRALELLEKIRYSIRDRLVPAWLRLTLEESTILLKTHPRTAKKTVEEGIEVATELRLPERLGQFQRLRASLK